MSTNEKVYSTLKQDDNNNDLINLEDNHDNDVDYFLILIYRKSQE